VLTVGLGTRRRGLSRRRTVDVIVAVVAVVMTAGCTGDDGPTRTAATASGSASPTVSVPAAWARCSVLAGSGKVTTFRSGDVGLSGVEFGTGATGVVLAPPVGETLCDWVVYATQLARLGYRVLAFDFAGTGASATPHGGGVSADADVTAAVQFLRDSGVQAVALVGAADGAAAAIVVATRLTPPPAAVVGLSTASTLATVDLRSVVPTLQVPVMYVTGEQDRIAQVLYKATRSTTTRQIVVSRGDVAGTGILYGPSAVSITTEIGKFLKQHAPPR
jgi:alpha/beta superfamily hydrolase